MTRKTFILFSQVFVPDPASVGQHMADVAVEMARRGWRVIVYASARGYEDPTRTYPLRERFHGVEIRRLPFASFGKKSILARVLGTLAFMIQALVHGLVGPKPDGVFFSTSPPMMGVIATLVARLRGAPRAYWAMDLNPDQLIALGKLTPTSPVAQILEAVNRSILRAANLVIALDRFMASRLERRVRLDGRMLVMPPWPHEQAVVPIPHAQNPFRQKHGLDGKFVVMYSGNHSPSNPLTTLLHAADRLRDDPNIRFLFVGGGIGKREVEAFIKEKGLNNAISLPYQPLADLRFSLSAADVHVVSLGSEMVGIIHPCKVYGAMAVGRPVLFLGPRPSHISDLLELSDFGRHVEHGDVDGAVKTLSTLSMAGPAACGRMGQAAKETLDRTLSQTALCGVFCDRLEQAFRDRPMTG